MGTQKTDAQWTHYERLGVPEGATDEEIRRAYRKVVKDLHSDGKAGPYAGVFEELTKDLNVARDTLLDPARRARYDRGLAAERLDARRREATAAAGAGAGESRSAGDRPKAGRGTGRRGARGDPPGGPGGGSGGASGARAGSHGPGNRRGATGEGDGGARASSGPRGAKTEAGAGAGAGAETPRAPAGDAAGSSEAGAGGWVGAFARVEEHPRAHLAGASAFVAAAYLVALVVGARAGGALGISAVFVGVPLLGLVLPAVLRRAARRPEGVAGRGSGGGSGAGWGRAELLSRSLLWGSLGLWTVSVVALFAPGAAAGGLEVLVNGAFVAVGLYPLLWAGVGAVALARRAADRLRKRRPKSGGEA